MPAATTVTLWQFDDKVTRVLEHLPLAELPEFSLRPRGRTALLDAVGRALSHLGEHLESVPQAWRPGEVVVVIVTDGKENASREYTKSAINQMITIRQEQGWRFVYVAADAEAFAAAAGIGIRRETVLPMDRGGTRASMAMAGRMVSRGGRTGDYGFTDDERGTTT